MEVTASQMLDDAYLAERAKLIDLSRATHFCTRYSTDRRYDLPDGRR